MLTNHAVMLVEDDDVDILSTKRAFKELSINNRLIVHRNGEDALTYLNDKANLLPSLILLDLNMSKVNGIEFLKLYKEQERLCWIPSVILTTSNNHRDVESAFKHQTSGYFVKPLDFERYKEVIRMIFDYWSLCELPEVD